MPKKLSGQEWYDKFWEEFTKTPAEQLAKHPELVLDYLYLVTKKVSGVN